MEEGDVERVEDTTNTEDDVMLGIELGEEVVKAEVVVDVIEAREEEGPVEDVDNEAVKEEDVDLLETEELV